MPAVLLVKSSGSKKISLPMVKENPTGEYLTSLAMFRGNKYRVTAKDAYTIEKNNGYKATLSDYDMVNLVNMEQVVTGVHHDRKDVQDTVNHKDLIKALNQAVQKEKLRLEQTGAVSMCNGKVDGVKFEIISSTEGKLYFKVFGSTGLLILLRDSWFQNADSDNDYVLLDFNSKRSVKISKIKDIVSKVISKDTSHYDLVLTV